MISLGTQDNDDHESLDNDSPVDYEDIDNDQQVFDYA